ncbi:hypothetical protein GH714_041697 [Hevea brasiliensis]|uniref:DUF1421 domain-containing protein n=1 Tax=Hevea brasiliensis TaxID=3981 RepID=A0A6A6MVM6_HEVBR|nr:hypothetical protein GH714_041697 [Hevea brasiliensis]
MSRTPRNGSGKAKLSPGLKLTMEDLAVDKIVSTGVGLVPPEKDDMYEGLHSHLKKVGIDGVKVDVIHLLEMVCENYGGRVDLAKAYYKALTASVRKHFNGNGVIASMEHCNDFMILGTEAISLGRVGDDFWCIDPSGDPNGAFWLQGCHMVHCAYNSLWMGNFIHPDWDMFQSTHPCAEFHAASRAISGGPIYISDSVGNHNFPLLKRLVLPDVNIIAEKSIQFAPIGLVNMLNTGGAIQSLAYNDSNRSVRIGVKGAGEMRIFASEKPRGCRIDEKEVGIEYEECMVVVQVPWSASSGVSMVEKEEIVPSYDFQPVRSIASSLDSSIPGLGAPTSASRVWNSADSKSNSVHISAALPIRNYGSLDSIEPARVLVEKDQNASDVAIVSEIDKSMKKYADNLVHILEGVSARLTQLESRTRHLENSVDDLKLSVENNHGSTDGKIRHLENILREVQTGVHLLKEKQEIVESQLQLTKLQVSKGGQQQSETQNSGHMDTVQQAASALHNLTSSCNKQHLPLHILTNNFLPSLFHNPFLLFLFLFPPAVPPPPIFQQNLSPPAPLPNQLPQSQIPSVPQREPYYSPPSQTQDPPNLQYQVSPSQHSQPSHAGPPHQSYQLAPQPQYSQPPQLPQPQTQPLVSPASGAPPSPQFYGAPSHIFEPPSSRPSSGFSAGYDPPSGTTESYPYGGPPSQYGSKPPMKPQQLSSLAMSHSAGSGYPQLPTARILPHALPTASGVGGGSSSSGTGNRVPIDDVVDKVTNMGFPREHVRATVRKLTENGESVDLNIVLDKLMNDGEVQFQRSWLGR